MILTTLGALVLASAAATPAQAAEEETYYLALGDSLAAGAQPVGEGNAVVATNEGYADQLYAKLKESDPNLRLVKLGCVGETAKSFVYGGVCGYDGAGSQLGAARNFLRKNGAKVKYLTISIGAQEVYGCITPTGADTGCMLKGLASAGLYMPQVVGGIKLAASARTRLMGMNWYNPAVAAWLLSDDGKNQAKQSQLLSGTLNLKMKVNYGAWGFKLADVCADWRCDDWTEDTPFNWPRNVWDLMTRTWMPNVIGNWLPKAHGYGYIADTFAKVSS
ncbi:SGNH/GDSL hydrolase family protein [Sphaerisporangium fuscum]|uniref:SGNH/GDSL hydrolase family protein n=1 Tax=Sphaerisporangium fuscum TaxID=2835868 RepID=UPI001BDD748C|nr:SGNH/GDSL hydrolase family protein [Sphaerisporangium fuscum]